MAIDTQRNAALAAFDLLPVAVAIFDRALRFVEVNEAMARLDGLPAGDHTGRSGPELLPRLSTEPWDALRRVIASGQPERGVIGTGDPPGTAGSGPWQADYVPWRDPATGAVLGAVAVVVDVTPREPAEAAAARVKARLEGIAALSAELVGLAAIGDVAQALARGARRAMGGQAAVVAMGTGDEIRIFPAPGYDAEAEDAFRRGGVGAGTALGDTARTGTPHAYNAGPEWDAAFPAGAALHRSLGLAALVTVPLVRGGARVGAIGVSFDRPQPFTEEDLTALGAIASIGGEAMERALNAEARDETRTLLQAVADHLPVGVLVVDPERRVLYANSEARRIVGKPIEVGSRLPDHIFVERGGHPPVAEESSLLGALRGAPVADHEVQVRAPDGRVVDLQLSAAPVRGDGDEVRFAIAVLSDVSERRRTEALRDAFVDVLAHELRTPLTLVFGNIALLADRGASLSAADAAGLLASAHEEAARLVALVEDLVVLSRIERRADFVSLEPVLLERIAEDAVAAEAARPGGLSASLVVGAAARPVLAEEAYVRQVLRNLLSNAHKYGAPPVEVIVSPEADGTTVRVLDRGPGFAGDPDRLFELYAREAAAARRAPGSGVGLFVCRELVRLMGGRIWARAREGGGAEFGFALPLLQPDEE